jgi:hypothetical protein
VAGSERRASPRFACDVEARIELPDGSHVDARTIDISFSGICLHAESPVPARMNVDFHLKLIFKWAESDTMTVPGITVWCTPVEGLHQIGARFDNQMDSASWARLDVLLQFLSGDLELAPQK